MKLRTTFINNTLIVCALLLSGNLVANIINVPADHSTIQAAINASATGDTILVQPGTYNQNINFNGKGITVGSLFITTGDEAHIATTIINGGGSNSSVKFNSGETSSSILTGFTITNGYAYYGAGVYCSTGSSPALSYLKIENNDGHPGDSYGGGLCCLDNSNPTCSNITMNGNYAEAGGAVYCHNNSEPYFTDCVFFDNNANHGGAILTSYSHPQFDYCSIYENTANSAGAGIYASFHSQPSFTNCTVVDNTTPGWGGGFYCNDIYGEPNILNCIVWGNSSDYNLQIFATVANPVVTYTDVQDGTGEDWFGIGCIDNDPLFTDVSNDDYTLTEFSPCIDAGDPTSPPDPDGTNVDQGAYPYYVAFTADFSASPTNVCAGSTVQFTDNSIGSPTSWNWTFEGGTPATSTDQNPIVTYNTAGEYDVTLAIADASYSNTLVKENYIIVSIPVSQASTPVGPADVCGGTEHEYTTQDVTGANSYTWEVNPADAGSIIGTGIVGTFTADDTWTGDYTIKVRASNGCGDGTWSDNLTCTIGLQPIAYVLSDGGGYCEGGTGIEVILDGSEVDVDYELFLESVSIGNIESGTGNPINFGYQTEPGIYTVIGTAGVCSENMVGTPYIFTTTLPSAASTPVGPTSICDQSTTDYSISAIGGAESTIWILIPIEAGIIIGEGIEITIEWDSDFVGIALLTAQGENSCGLGTLSDALEITCSLPPSPEINGLTLVCDNEESEYSTLDITGNTYEWTVTGGEITNGSGTSIITVLWAEPGLGTVSLLETSGENCSTIAELLNINIDDCTGLEEINDNNIIIYPNPTTYLLNVKSEVQIISYEILNFTGNVLLTEYVNNNTCKINTTILKPGMYMIIMKTRTGKYREKLIVD